MNLMTRDDLLVGVRPERIRLTSVPDGRLTGQIRRVAHAGDDATTYVDCDGHPSILVRLPWSDRPELGPRESTLTLPLHLYLQGFRYGDLGYVSMLSMLLMVATGALLLPWVWLYGRRRRW